MAGFKEGSGPNEPVENGDENKPETLDSIHRELVRAYESALDYQKGVLKFLSRVRDSISTETKREELTLLLDQGEPYSKMLGDNIEVLSVAGERVEGIGPADEDEAKTKERLIRRLTETKKSLEETKDDLAGAIEEIKGLLGYST